jgi:hypothetical protein
MPDRHRVDQLCPMQHLLENQTDFFFYAEISVDLTVSDQPLKNFIEGVYSAYRESAARGTLGKFPQEGKVKELAVWISELDLYRLLYIHEMRPGQQVAIGRFFLVKVIQVPVYHIPCSDWQCSLPP